MIAVLSFIAGAAIGAFLGAVFMTSAIVVLARARRLPKSFMEACK